MDEPQLFYYNKYAYICWKSMRMKNETVRTIILGVVGGLLVWYANVIEQRVSKMHDFMVQAMPVMQVNAEKIVSVKDMVKSNSLNINSLNGRVDNLSLKIAKVHPLKPEEVGENLLN